jgi:hypothetical protein
MQRSVDADDPSAYIDALDRYYAIAMTINSTAT